MELDVVGDPRFFARSGPYTLAEVIHAAGGTADADADLIFDGVAPLQSACEQQISFLHDRRYAGVLDTTRAGAVLVPPDLAGRVPTASVAILVEATYEGWARVAALFHPVSATLPGTHPLALVSPTAAIDPSAEVGPFCMIESGVSIGPGCRIGPYVSVGKGVQIGHNVRLGKCCVIVAQVGISGSTVLEDFVQVGGQAAFTGHVTIGRGAQVGAQAGVISDIAPGAVMLGSPAQPRQNFFRQVATLKRLAKRTTPLPPTSSA